MTETRKHPWEALPAPQADLSIPRDEIRFKNREGETVGRIVNLPPPQPEAKEERFGRWTQAEWRQVLSHFKTAQELNLLVEELLTAAFAGREK